MKKLKTLSMMLAVAALTLLPSKGMAQFNWKYKIEGGKIVTEVPQRTAGQQSALLLKTPKLKTVRVAFVGWVCVALVLWRDGRIYPVYRSWHCAIMRRKEQKTVKST